MKNLLLAILLCATDLTGMAQDVRIEIKQAAEKCAKSLLTGDYEGFATYTHKRVVALMGGKEAMVAVLKREIERMRSEGYDFADAVIGNPAEPVKIGTWVTALVPEEVIMKVPGGRLHQDAFLLAVSEDDGKHWAFLDLGPITPAQFAKIFPELEGKVQLPEKREPVFHKNN